MVGPYLFLARSVRPRYVYWATEKPELGFYSWLKKIKLIVPGSSPSPLGNIDVIGTCYVFK